mgnify:CR=1 FL=1
MATQTCIEFPDTCLTCKGRGVITSVQTIITRGHVRIIEQVHPCVICHGYGVIDFHRYAKEQMNMLYGKFYSGGRTESFLRSIARENVNCLNGKFARP